MKSLILLVAASAASTALSAQTNNQPSVADLRAACADNARGAFYSSDFVLSA